jgi:hypothetical protein
MTSTSQDAKRQRASSFAGKGKGAGAVTAPSGSLSVVWESAFDQMCHAVAADDLAVKNARRYRKLMDEIVESTGCTEEEVLAHGRKVRAVLYFAQDRLSREGALRHLTGKARYEYRLPPVNHAF